MTRTLAIFSHHQEYKTSYVMLDLWRFVVLESLTSLSADRFFEEFYKRYRCIELLAPDFDSLVKTMASKGRAF